MNALTFTRRAKRRGFILFEAILAVIIFSIGVLTLAKCVQACLRAEMVKDQDARAMRCLQNRMAEIEAGAVPTDKPLNIEMKDGFAGMKLHQERKTLKRKNEKDQDILGLYMMALDLTWRFHNEEQRRTLQFYIYPREG